MKSIEREHPEYIAKKTMWERYRDFYTGGEQFKNHAGNYLIRRQKEPADVYWERLDRVFYENYAGSIIDWYAATLFRREPIISVEGSNEAGRTFFNEFTEDCDLKGSSITDFFRKLFVDSLISGASYAMVDFPRPAHVVSNRAEEDRLGRSRAYLVGYSAEDVINWSRDEHGNFDWVVLRTNQWTQETTDSEALIETHWIFLDKQRFQKYKKNNTAESNSPPQMVEEGLHALSKLNRVPLFDLRVSDGLWLMNKAAQLQLEHFNKSNALAWALTMGLFANPVVYSDREWNQIVGESYYIQLGPNDRFGWAEPEGKVYNIASENLVRLKEEIYRVCYLLSQAAPAGIHVNVSGISRQRDFAITQEVLRAYGDAVKDTLKRVLKAVEQVREDNLTLHASGLDEFDITDFLSEVDEAKRLLEIGIDSPTLRKQIYKKLAFHYLSDERQEVKDAIATEIEAMFGQKGN